MSDINDPNLHLRRIEKKTRELSVKNGEYKEFMVDYAEAMRDYKVARAKEMLKQKSEGQSVTLIKSLTEGIKHVAELEFKMNVAEAMVKACRTSMGNIHAVLDGTRSTLTWLRNEKGQG